MLFYLFPYLFLFSFSLIYYKVKNIRVPGIVVLFLFLIPAMLVVLLRGDVGPDTLNYLGYFKDLQTGTNLQEFEPGFEWIANSINYFGLDERVSIAIVSFITILCLGSSFSGSKEQIVVFAALVFPLFFYDMTMNGLRYGLSFALAGLSIQAFYKNKILLFLVLAFCCISIQYSSFLIIAVFVPFELKGRVFWPAIIIGFIILISAGAYLDLSYLYDKQDLYKDITSPGATSGIGPLFIFLMLYSSFILFANKTGRFDVVIHAILVLHLLSFVLAKFTYAGLRLQNLFLFALLLFIKQHLSSISKVKTYFIVLAIVGLFGFLLQLKNFYAVVEDVESPFLPYRFFFNEND